MLGCVGLPIEEGGNSDKRGRDLVHVIEQKQKGTERYYGDVNNQTRVHTNDSEVEIIRENFGSSGCLSCPVDNFENFLEDGAQ